MAGCPKVAITINRHSWRSRIASMDGRFLVGISAANRAAAKIALGDEIEVTLELDIEPRVVAEPTDLAMALDTNQAVRAAFDRLPFGLRRKRVSSVNDVKTEATRQRRIDRLMGSLR